jgi:hypothetical protein
VALTSMHCRGLVLHCFCRLRMRYA